MSEEKIEDRLHDAGQRAVVLAGVAGDLSAVESFLGRTRTRGAPLWVSLRLNEMQKELRLMSQRLMGPNGDLPPERVAITDAGRAIVAGDEPQWTDNPEATHDLILLVVDRFEDAPSLDVVNGWTPEQRRLVDEYCAAVHLSASDNEDVVIPAIPEFLSAAMYAARSGGAAR